MRRMVLVGNAKTIGVFLHNIVGSDAAAALHDHPWRWAVALILRGGYVEERRRRGNSTSTGRFLSPGRFNVLRPGVFHRVELRRARAAWTLFVHGPKVRRWGYLDSLTGAFRFWAPTRPKAA